MNKTDFALIEGGIWENVKGKANIHILTPETYFNPLGDIIPNTGSLSSRPLCQKPILLLNALGRGTC